MSASLSKLTERATATDLENDAKVLVTQTVTVDGVEVVDVCQATIKAITDAVADDIKARQTLKLDTESGIYEIKSPKMFQQLCASERIGSWLNVGDRIYIPWTDYTRTDLYEFQYPFVVVDIADCYDENDVLHRNALWLVAENCVQDQFQMPYDAAETGNPKGCFMWSQSVARQWLNSDAGPNEGWWTSQHVGDASPGSVYTNRPGWMCGFREEWKEIFKPVKVVTATGEQSGSPEETTYDKFFIPSVSQLYGNPRTAVFVSNAPFDESDTAWEYFRMNSSSDVPTCEGSELPLELFGKLNKTLGSGEMFSNNLVLLRSCCYLNNSKKYYFTMQSLARVVDGNNLDKSWPFVVQTTVVNNYFRLNPCCVLF